MQHLDSITRTWHITTPPHLLNYILISFDYVINGGSVLFCLDGWPAAVFGCHIFQVTTCNKPVIDRADC